MEWIFQEEEKRIISDKVNYGNWRDDILAAFSYLQENRSLILNAFHSLSRSALEQYLKSRFYPVMKALVDNRIGATAIAEEDREFIIGIYVMALIGIVFEWMDHDMDGVAYSASLEKLLKLVDGSMEYAINKFREE